MSELPLYDVHVLRNEAVRRCQQAGLSVRFDPDAETAMTDGKTITIPEIKRPFSRDAAKLLRMQIVHECGHVDRPDSYKILREYKPKTDLHNIFNMVEDESQERQVANRYIGDARALAEGHLIWVTRQINAVRSKEEELRKTGSEFGPRTLRGIAAYRLMVESRHDWDDMSPYLTGPLDKSLPAESLRIYEELKSEGWVEKLRESITPRDTWECSKDLYRRLFDEDPEEQMQNPKGDGDADGEGKTSRDAKAQAEGTEAGAEGAQHGKGQPDDEPVPNDKWFEIPWEELVHSNHEVDGKMGSEGNRINWEGKKKTKAVPDFYLDHETEVIDYSGTDKAVATKKAKRRPARHVGGRHTMPVDDAINNRAFANQVRRMIQAMMRTKWRTEQRSGALNKRSLTRVIMPPINGGDWNSRVFRKREEEVRINTAVTILCDMSGSMSGTKAQLACLAAQRFNDVFARALHVPCEVLTFTTGHSSNLMGVIRAFAEKNLSNQELANRFGDFSNHMAGNADADAVMFALRRLKERNEERKVLIVLSDGSPTDSKGWQDADSLLLAVTHDIAVHHKDVELYGIGIMDRNVKRYYGAHAMTVSRAEDLNQCLLSTLRDAVVVPGN